MAASNHSLSLQPEGVDLLWVNLIRVNDALDVTEIGGDLSIHCRVLALLFFDHVVVPHDVNIVARVVRLVVVIILVEDDGNLRRCVGRWVGEWVSGERGGSYPVQWD